MTNAFKCKKAMYNKRNFMEIDLFLRKLQHGKAAEKIVHI